MDNLRASGEALVISVVIVLVLMGLSELAPHVVGAVNAAGP